MNEKIREARIPVFRVYCVSYGTALLLLVTPCYVTAYQEAGKYSADNDARKDEVITVVETW